MTNNPNLLPIADYKAAISKLPPTSECYAIVSARYFGTVISQNVNKKMLSNIYHKIGDCIKTLGHYNMENSEKTVEHIGEGILKVIKEKFPTLTDQEFYIIMDYGIRDRYMRKGDLRTVNIINIEKWITAYKVDSVVKNAFQLFDQKMRERTPKKEPTPEELEAIRRNDCVEAFELFKAKQELPMAAEIIFKQLKQDKFFHWNAEQIEFIEDEAQEKCRENIASLLGRGDVTAAIGKTYFQEVEDKKGFRYERECRRSAIKLLFTMAIAKNNPLYKVKE